MLPHVYMFPPMSRCSPPMCLVGRLPTVESEHTRTPVLATALHRASAARSQSRCAQWGTLMSGCKGAWQGAWGLWACTGFRPGDLREREPSWRRQVARTLLAPSAKRMPRKKVAEATSALTCGSHPVLPCGALGWSQDVYSPLSVFAPQPPLSKHVCGCACLCVCEEGGFLVVLALRHSSAPQRS